MPGETSHTSPVFGAMSNSEAHLYMPDTAATVLPAIPWKQAEIQLDRRICKRKMGVESSWGVPLRAWVHAVTLESATAPRFSHAAANDCIADNRHRVRDRHKHGVPKPHRCCHGHSLNCVCGHRKSWYPELLLPQIHNLSNTMPTQPKHGGFCWLTCCTVVLQFFRPKSAPAASQLRTQLILQFSCLAKRQRPKSDR